MACCLFSTKPLSETMLPYCQLDPKEHISMKFYSKFKSFYSRKCTWKCHLPKWRPSCPASICKLNTSYDFIINTKIWICFNHNVDTSCNVFHGTWNLNLPPIPFAFKHYAMMSNEHWDSQITSDMPVCSTIFSNKVNIEVSHYWPFIRESTCDQWISLTKGQ